MGEIKSTLDLVMERTRHLSLSEEEKERQRREDFEKRFQGLLQQYADENRSVDHLVERLAALQQEMKLSDPQSTAAIVIGRIDPDRENRPWLALLERLAPEALPSLQDLLETHERQESQCLQKGREAVAARLAEDYGIRGSAVVPNPHKDAAARRELAALRDETRSAIDALAEKVG